MLVVIQEGQKPRFYVFKDGFLYYTPKPFKRNSTRVDEIITTGYIDRSIYEHNPMTHQDLAQYIGIEAYNILVKNIDFAINAVRECYSDMLSDKNKRLQGTKFSIFGVDIAPDNKLGCKIMEINKGPDLTYKDERDRKVKLNMVKDALNIVGIMGTNPSKNLGGFREIS
jgi:hypothetical protein